MPLKIVSRVEVCDDATLFVVGPFFHRVRSFICAAGDVPCAADDGGEEVPQCEVGIDGQEKCMEFPRICHEADKSLCRVWQGCSVDNCPAAAESEGGGNPMVAKRKKRQTAGDEAMEEACGANDEACKRDLVERKVGPKVTCRETTMDVCPYRPEFLMVRKKAPAGTYVRTTRTTLLLKRSEKQVENVRKHTFSRILFSSQMLRLSLYHRSRCRTRNLPRSTEKFSLINS